MSHRVLQGSVLAATQFRFYFVIQVLYIKFRDGKNLGGKESIGKDQNILTKMEIRPGGEEQTGTS